MATPGYNFGEWPLAILSEVFFYFIRLHAPVNGCVQRQQYPNAGCNWVPMWFTRIKTSPLMARLSLPLKTKCYRTCGSAGSQLTNAEG